MTDRALEERPAAVRHGTWRWPLQAGAVALVCVLLVLLASRLASEQRGHALAAAVAAGRTPPAPDFSLARLDRGGLLRLSSLRGRVVVLNFWASWCEPCKAEAPRLEDAWSRWRERGVVVLGLDAQDFRADARRFLHEHRLGYPNVHDGPGSVVDQYGVTGFPETWVVDRKGRLVAHVEGPVTRAEIDRAVSVTLRR
jgi:cytochrome c biogenesis protein CcmG/thiol:disulfide interchange protein DsbE